MRNKKIATLFLMLIISGFSTGVVPHALPEATAAAMNCDAPPRDWSSVSVGDFVRVCRRGGLEPVRLVRRTCGGVNAPDSATWRSERCPLRQCHPRETAKIRANEKIRAEAFVYDPVLKCRGNKKIQIPAMDDPRCMVPLFEGTPRKARLVVHHTEGPRDEGVEKLYAHHVLKLGYSDIGYHYFISFREGAWRVFETRPLWAEGGHIRATANSGTIGVAIAGNYIFDRESKDGPAPGAVAQLLKLIQHLETQERIEITGIAAHDDLLREHNFCAKGCPGPASEPLVFALKANLNGK